LRKLAAILSVSAMFLAILSVVSLAGEMKKGETTMTGYVTDSMCKGEGAKAEHKDCALKCAREKGAKLGIWDAASSKFYALQDQKKAEEFAGEMVTVKGTVDETTGTLNASSISKAEKKNG
jgi:hypothetical protein